MDFYRVFTKTMAIICVGLLLAQTAGAAVIETNGLTFLVDQTGERWDISQAKSIGFEPQYFEFGIGHADAIETSVMMASYPESVDLGELPPPPEPLRYVDWAVVDSDAFRGNPTEDHTLREEADPRLRASTALGRQVHKQAVDEIEGMVRRALRELGYG